MFDWYFLISKTEFEATGLTSFEGTVVLKGQGLKTFLVTKGNLISFLFDDILLPINMNNKNPYRYGTYAVFLDASDDVWLGIYREV